MRKISTFILIISTFLFISAICPKITAFGYDIQEVQQITAEELKAKIDRLYPKNEISQYADAFLDASETDGFNVNFIVAIAIHESGAGRSKLAKEHGNLFGMKFKGKYIWWDDKSGLNTEYGIYYETWILKKRYIEKGAKTISDIGITYCDDKWAGYVGKIWQKLEDV